MPDLKPAPMSLAALALISVGAIGGRATVPSYELGASPSAMHVLADGQVAVDFATKLGACAGDRQLVFDADGNNPRLNGKPMGDDDSKSIGAVAVELNKKLAILSTVTKGTPGAVVFLSDGQLAINMEVPGDRANQRGSGAQIVYEADGSNPRINGAPDTNPVIASLGPELATFKAAVAKGAEPLRGELVAPLERIDPAPEK